MPTKKRHHCEPGSVPHGAYGSAIDYCFEDKRGAFWVTNGEYESRVNFCPFCSEKAPAQVDWATVATEQEVERVRRRVEMLNAEAKAREEREVRAARIAERDAAINPVGLYPCTDKVLDAADLG